MKLDLPGQTALVTGGSRGIGAATVRLLASAGVRVALHFAKSRDLAETLAKEIAETGQPEPVLVQGDLASETERRKVFEEAVRGLSRIDHLVNNAGIFERNPMDEGHDDALFLARWRHTLNVNLEAAVHLTYLALPAMRARRFGRIVMVSSRAAFRGETDCADYAVSKAGMVNLARCLARAEGKHGITANAVCPGWVETDMAQADLLRDREAILGDIPLGRVATAEDVARAILFYVSPLGSYANGTALGLNGGSFLH
ncbi:MAG: 3-oxoacyl-[acyl-carrier-protein] reductase FabG [Thermoanaerobaculia bacterium]|nr:3-oxoacyl-[acyl-carrier-protein] reductase FabG [Thermoanaerobaculia bacterium]